MEKAGSNNIPEFQSDAVLAMLRLLRTFHNVFHWQN